MYSGTASQLEALCDPDNSRFMKFGMWSRIVHVKFSLIFACYGHGAEAHRWTN